MTRLDIIANLLLQALEMAQSCELPVKSQASTERGTTPHAAPTSKPTPKPTLSAPASSRSADEQSKSDDSAPRKWVTAPMISEDFGVSLRTAYDWMQRMPHFREGRIVRVSRSAYEAFKRNRMQEGDDGFAAGGGSLPSVTRKSKRKATRVSAGRSQTPEKEPIHIVRAPRRVSPVQGSK
jgi:hypothetical protein